MAATVETSVEAFDVASATTLESASISLAGADRRLLVGVLSADAGTPVDPSAVRWKGSGGTSLTKDTSVGGSVSANGSLSFWQLVAPATGSGTIHVTWGSNQLVRALIAVAVQDANQSSYTAHNATGTNTTPSDSVTSTAGDLVIDFAAFIRLAGGSATISPTAGQTSLQEIEGADLDAGGGGVGGLVSSSKSASGASTTMSWTISMAPDNWRTILVAIPAVGGGGGSVIGAGLLHSLALYPRSLVGS